MCPEEVSRIMGSVRNHESQALVQDLERAQSIHCCFHLLSNLCASPELQLVVVRLSAK
jgi:hypothetical protein